MQNVKKKCAITACIFDGNTLIGVKITNQDWQSRLIKKCELDMLFSNYDVVNCNYRYGKLTSKCGLDIKKYPRYNKHLRMNKYRLIRESHYTESEVISKAFGVNLELAAYKICGAICGAITDPDSAEASKHAELYYNEIRKMTRDVNMIAKNTGYSISLIQDIKNYLFMDEHMLLTGRKRFDPSFQIAQSWQRLMSKNKKDIQPHDFIMIEHEILEKKLVNNGMEQDMAHIEASKKYNYSVASDIYYNSIKNKKQIKGGNQ